MSAATHTLLHIDSSARPGLSGRQPHGSHTRRLGARFVQRWQAGHPGRLVYRDVGAQPPSPVTGDWIAAAFTPPSLRTPQMRQALAESDALVAELQQADLVVIGVPMYNFGPPAQLKAWVDNIVRVGLTFGFDRSRAGVPYWPLLAGQGRQVVLLGSRGDYGYADAQAGMNHAEPALRAALGYIGLDQVHELAVEYDEYGGERLAQSLDRAESAVDRLVDELLAQRAARVA